MNRIVLTLLVAAAFLGACGSGGPEPARPATADSAAVPTVAPVPAVIVAAPGRSGAIVMPDMTGRSLLHSYEDLVAAGMTRVTREDASGLARSFVNDSIWIVCMQVPEAGADVATNEAVTLYAVKVGEDCPGG